MLAYLLSCGNAIKPLLFPVTTYSSTPSVSLCEDDVTILIQVFTLCTLANAYRHAIAASLRAIGLVLASFPDCSVKDTTSRRYALIYTKQRDGYTVYHEPILYPWSSSIDLLVNRSFPYTNSPCARSEKGIYL